MHSSGVFLGSVIIIGGIGGIVVVVLGLLWQWQ